MIKSDLRSARMISVLALICRGLTEIDSKGFFGGTGIIFHTEGEDVQGCRGEMDRPFGHALIP